MFTAVGAKVDLLKIAMDWAVAGDDLPVPLADRDTLRELLEQSDPTALLTGWGRLQAEIGARVGALSQALEVAAGTEDDARVLMARVQEQRLDGARKIVKRLRTLGVLTADLTVQEAVDLAWLATDAALFDRLVRVRGWSTSRFGEWLGAVSDRAIDRHIVRFSYMPQRASNALVNAAIDVPSTCSHRSRAFSKTASAPAFSSSRGKLRR